MDAWTKRQLSLLIPRLIMGASLIFSVMILFTAWNPFIFVHFIFAFWVCHYIDKEDIDLSEVTKDRFICVAIDFAVIVSMLYIDYPIIVPFLLLGFNYYFVVFRNRNILDNVQRRMLFLSDPALHFMLFFILVFAFLGNQ